MTFSRPTRYARCNRCLSPMIGIMERTARDRCHGCGGIALIGHSTYHRERVARARERFRTTEPPKPTPRPFRFTPGSAA